MSLMFLYSLCFVYMYIKIRLSTGENIGSGPIHLPEEEIHTSAAWFELHEAERTFEEKTLEQLLLGIANVLQHIVPAFVMCDRSDIHVISQIKAAHTGKPTVFLYDHYPGGIGLSKEVQARFDEIARAATQLIERCSCENGCPSCIGMEMKEIDGKSSIIQLMAGF